MLVLSGLGNPLPQELELNRGLCHGSCGCQGSFAVRHNMSVDERTVCFQPLPSGPLARPNPTSAAYMELPFSKDQAHNQTELDGLLCSRKYCSQRDREVQQMVTDILVSGSPCPQGTKYLLDLRVIQVVIISCCAFGPTAWIKKVQAYWDLLIQKNASR